MYLIADYLTVTVTMSVLLVTSRVSPGLGEVITAVMLVSTSGWVVFSLVRCPTLYEATHLSTNYNHNGPTSFIPTLVLTHFLYI
jgi:hypothetical protein